MLASSASELERGTWLWKEMGAGCEAGSHASAKGNVPHGLLEGGGHDRDTSSSCWVGGAGRLETGDWGTKLYLTLWWLCLSLGQYDGK